MHDESLTLSSARVPFCALVTTYARENPAFLRQALESLARQTCRAAQHVIVVDGPVDQEQEDVLREFEAILPAELVRLPRNVGLAGALNEGLKYCSQPWCARMDSDDICEPTRFEEQWSALVAEPSLDVVGTWTAEFERDPEVVVAYKTGPQTHERILKTLFWRCVVHHPTVVMRVAKIRQAGGYSTRFPLMEDYDLFLRMVAIGARMTILPRPLLRFRISRAQRRRRGGLRYLAVEARFRYFCARNGLTPPWVAASALLLLIPFRLVPGKGKEWAYRLVRKRP